MDSIPMECMMLNDLYQAIMYNGKKVAYEKENFDGVVVEKKLYTLNNSLWVITTTNGCITQLTTSAIRDFLNK